MLLLDLLLGLLSSCGARRAFRGLPARGRAHCESIGLTVGETGVPYWFSWRVEDYDDGWGSWTQSQKSED